MNEIQPSGEAERVSIWCSSNRWNPLRSSQQSTQRRKGFGGFSKACSTKRGLAVDAFVQQPIAYCGGLAVRKARVDRNRGPPRMPCQLTDKTLAVVAVQGACVSPGLLLLWTRDNCDISWLLESRRADRDPSVESAQVFELVGTFQSSAREQS